MSIAFLFLVLILSMFTMEPAKLKKSYSRISEKHEHTSINLTDVFGFIGQFSNFVAFDEIKWLCDFTKYTTQKLVTKS